MKRITSLFLNRCPHSGASIIALLLLLSLFAPCLAAGAASPSVDNPVSEPFAIQTEAGPSVDAKTSRLAGMAREGDIIFQTSVSRQSLAIKIATKSDYTHCGILLRKNGKLQVFEAAKTVTWTPLEAWVKRGVNQHYVLMRLKDPQTLTPEALAAIYVTTQAFSGKKYDLLFQWTDDKMYCSELVWKLYKRAGVELCEPHRFRDYDLNHAEVQKIMKERYGMDMPWDETVVAPSDLRRCPLLEVVDSN